VTEATLSALTGPRRCVNPSRPRQSCEDRAPLASHLQRDCGPARRRAADGNRPEHELRRAGDPMNAVVGAIRAVRAMPHPDHIVHRVRLAELTDLREALRKIDVTFAMPAYGEGPGIAAALEALQQAKRHVGLVDAPLLVSDSSPTEATVEAARQWAASSGTQVHIDRSPARRSLKQALNAIFDVATGEILVITVADVVVTPEGLADLLAPLIRDPPPDVVVGASLPDREMRSLARRAGAWQTRAVWRAVAALPPSTIRADGAFWAMSRRFIDSYRFPVGAGSIADDAELVRTLRLGQYRAQSVPSAVAYRVPPGSFADFRASLQRSRVANAEHRRFDTEYPAALAEAISDPLGAVCYIVQRLRMVVAGTPSASITEMWQPDISTKRND
jgi:cellulose synthase/poly-beta-1,6-N-acetylglucosamine synthase-like glycosyltransferase